MRSELRLIAKESLPKAAVISANVGLRIVVDVRRCADEVEGADLNVINTDSRCSR